MKREGVRTLIELIEHRGRATPELPALHFEDEPFPFGEFWRQLECFAGRLMALGVKPGDRVVLSLPNGTEFFVALFGVQRAGAVPVPTFPGSGVEGISARAQLCGACVAVVPDALLADVRDPLEAGPIEHATSVHAGSGPPPTARFPALRGSDVALIQYTSGSTGNPKGVVLRHDHLLANVRQLVAGLDLTPEDVFVSWLPVYHDMGLIPLTMVPFYLGAALYLLPSSLADLHPWLDAIGRHRASFTCAPDFAYRLCVRRIAEPERYDLSSLRITINGAEPVREPTLREFETKFGLRVPMLAAYGLAEATLGVSLSVDGRKVDDEGRVSVGRGMPEVELAIVRDDERCGPGEVGEIAVKSPANTAGYFENREATAALFWGDGFVLTGDLGYLDAEGDLFVIGRKKNLIIQAGESFYPEDIQEVVDATPGLRFSAALGIDRERGLGEQVYLFAEVREPAADKRELEAIAIDVVRRVHGRYGFRPARVTLLKPHAIPLTHNGKLRHAGLKARYERGELAAAGAIVFP